MEGSSELLAWCGSLNLRDIWWELHLTARVMNGPSGRSRLDLIFLCPELCANAKAHISPRLAG